MSEDANDDRPLWRRLLINRFVLVPGAILAIALAWNVFVSFHNNGIVEGRVVDAQGRPVEGASVALWALQFTTFVERERTVTEADGSFRFESNMSHHIHLAAEKPGLGSSDRLPVRLYFRAQDIELKQPLRIDGS